MQPFGHLHQQHVAVGTEALATPAAEFAPGCHVNVVLDANRHTEPLRQRCSQIKALPLGDEIAAQHGAVTVDDSGGGHRDLLEQAEPFRPAVPSFPDHTGNDIEPRFTTPVDELVGPDLENSPVKRGHHSQHRVDQHVSADDDPRTASRSPRGRRPSRSTVTTYFTGNPSILLQLTQQRNDGRPRQTGAFDQLSGSQSTVSTQFAQHIVLALAPTGRPLL